jgi:HPt (histidine-containing phosphotransfer) domain-containing protein
MQSPRMLPVFNREVALDRVGGDEDLLKEVAQLYLDEYPVIIGQIQIAVDTGNATELQRSAHTLKGSLGTLGAEQAAEQALRLEIMGRSQNMSGAASTLCELHKVLESFHDVIHGELKRV